MEIEGSARADDKGVGRRSGTGGWFAVSNASFETFMEEQILRIKTFRRRLEEERGRDVGLEEAARAWIQRHAEKFRRLYEEKSSPS